MLRKALTILISAAAVLALFGEPAQASPGNGDPSAKRAAVPFKVHAKSGLAGAKFAAVGSANRLDPPLGGCDYSDVTAQGTAWYTDGILSSVDVTWLADTICYTTAPGQAMAGIIADSSWWHNGLIMVNGRTGSCTLCTSTFSEGAWTGGPASA